MNSAVNNGNFCLPLSLETSEGPDENSGKDPEQFLMYIWIDACLMYKGQVTGQYHRQYSSNGIPELGAECEGVHRE